MRVPPPHMWQRWLSGIGLFLSGMVIGSAIYMSMHQTNFNLLVERNTVLKDENDNLKKEIQNWKKFRTDETVVKKITVRLESSPGLTPLDPAIEAELKQQVQKKLERIYVGHNVSIFTSGTEQERQAEIRKLQEIVSDQYTAKEHSYKVESASIAVVQTELIVYMKAKLFQAAPSSLFR